MRCDEREEMGCDGLKETGCDESAGTGYDVSEGMDDDELEEMGDDGLKGRGYDEVEGKFELFEGGPGEVAEDVQQEVEYVAGDVRLCLGSSVRGMEPVQARNT